MHNSALNMQGVSNRITAAFVPAQPLPNAPLAPRSPYIPSKLTISGVVLFITCAMMFGSGFKAMRPTIVGLLVHPFLIPIGIVSPFLLLNRLKLFPSRVLAALAIFLFLNSMANFTGGRAGLSEIFKIGVNGIAIVCTALLIRSRADFVAGVLGLGVAAAAMGIYGMQGSLGSSEGVQALDVGNKNAFSLFSLPSILLSGFIFLDLPIQSKPLRMLTKTLSMISIGGCVLAIFLSANRSGYLGCVIVAAMLLKEKKLYGVLLVGMIAAAIVYIMMSMHMTDVFQRRLKQTFEEKNSSDDLRAAIIVACFQIGLEYPLTGVSAPKLPAAIGNKVGATFAGMNVVESHNVFAHIWGSSGIPCFFALGFVAWTCWTMRPPSNKQDLALAAEFSKAQRLLRMLVVLWLIRGMFTAEILYNPGFALGMGLSIGYCNLLSLKHRNRPSAAGVPVMPNGYAVQY